jgi:hypothetical protein
VCNRDHRQVPGASVARPREELSPVLALRCWPARPARHTGVEDSKDLGGDRGQRACRFQMYSVFWRKLLGQNVFGTVQAEGFDGYGSCSAASYSAPTRCTLNSVS